MTKNISLDDALDDASQDVKAISNTSDTTQEGAEELHDQWRHVPEGYQPILL